MTTLDGRLINILYPELNVPIIGEPTRLRDTDESLSFRGTLELFEDTENTLEDRNIVKKPYKYANETFMLHFDIENYSIEVFHGDTHVNDIIIHAKGQYTLGFDGFTNRLFFDFYSALHYACLIHLELKTGAHFYEICEEFGVRVESEEEAE